MSTVNGVVFKSRTIREPEEIARLVRVFATNSFRSSGVRWNNFVLIKCGVEKKEWLCVAKVPQLFCVRLRKDGEWKEYALLGYTDMSSPMHTVIKTQTRVFLS